MKRILRMIPLMDPREGGPVAGIRSFTPLLAERGIATTILTNDDPQTDLPPIEGAEIIVCGPSKYGVFGYAPKMRDWLNEHHHEFDAVFVHGCWQYPGWAAWQTLARSRTPYFVYPHGMLDPWFNRRYPLKRLKKWLYWPWAEYRILRDARAVLYTSAEEMRLARQSFWLFRDRSLVVPYGIVENDEIRAAIARAADPAVPRPVVYLGRLHAKKGIELLLEAWRRLSPDVRPSQLIIYGVGEPGYEAELRIRIASVPDVRWAGPVWGAAKFRALADAGALILPSFQENFGLVVAEALAVGTPVLTTTGVNIGHDVAAAGAGWCDEPTVAGISRMLSGWHALSSGEKRKMRSAARSCFVEKYDLRRSVDRWIHVVETQLRSS